VQKEIKMHARNKNEMQWGGVNNNEGGCSDKKEAGP